MSASPGSGASAAMPFDVAIVGYGPAGALLANLLGPMGLSVCVIERDADVYPLPRAIHYDGEVMRIFQSVGLRAAAEHVSRPGLKGMHFVNGQDETMMIRGGTAAVGMHGCANNYYFHQPQFEQVLREGVRRFEKVQIRLQHEVMEILPGPEQVALQVRDLRSGQLQTVHARYVVGCDGGRSMVRRMVSHGTTDLGLHQPWLVFDVLMKPGAPELPDYTVQHCDPARPMTSCCVTGNRRRWEIMLMPGDDPERMVQTERLWELVSRWVRPEHAQIERAVIYTFHSIIAQGWRKGRLMIAGDAAHQTPPFLGQGMCAAMRDVANLAWKLELVLKGQAPQTLLDTYESERAPHVHAFIDLAVRLGDIIQTTDPEQARERDARFRGGQPEVFQYPAPRLGPGVLAGDGAVVGRPFPQPRLRDGHLLDELLGRHFAVIARPAALQAVSETMRQAATAASVMLLATQDPALLDWLDEQQVDAVVLRPDRYVMAVAPQASGLEALMAAIPGVQRQTVAAA